MSWARYDDEFPMNRKVGRLVGQGQAGIAAIGLHVLANTYARHNGTAGVIEPHVPALLCGGSIGKKLARMLAEVGMFDELPEGGWTIHDYAEYHDPNDPEPDRSAADRKKELSEKRAEAGRKGGLAKAARQAKQTASNATDLPEGCKPVDNDPGGAQIGLGEREMRTSRNPQVSGTDNDLPGETSSKRLAKPWQCSTPVPEPVPPTSSNPPPPPCTRPDDGGGGDQRRHHIATQAAQQQAHGRNLDHPDRWITKARTSILTEHRQRIDDLIDRFPDAPDTVIAAAINGDTHSLAYYAPTHTEQTEPDDQRLTADQRNAILTNARKNPT